MADVFSIARTVLPIRGETDTFPVRRIYCVGRNYADHAVEMGHNPQREPPFFFPSRQTPSLPTALQLRTRAPRRTFTTRSSWWWPSAWAAPTSRRTTR